MAKKLFSSVLLAIIIITAIMPGVQAFTLFGVDFSKFWDSVSFWNDDYVDDSVSKESPVQNNAKINPGKSLDVKEETRVKIGSQSYTESDLKYLINNNEKLKGYVQSFNYDCVYFKSDGSSSFTLNFNTKTGELKNIELAKTCEREVYIEGELIYEIKENGFKASNIKNYLKEVDLPASMYFKAIKVFTVG